MTDRDDRYRDDTIGDELDLVGCPECPAPAEVVDRFALSGTDGPLEHVKIQCLARHWFLMPVTMLPAVGTVVTPSGTGPVR